MPAGGIQFRVYEIVISNYLGSESKDTDLTLQCTHAQANLLFCCRRRHKEGFLALRLTLFFVCT